MMARKSFNGGNACSLVDEGRDPCPGLLYRCDSLPAGPRAKLSRFIEYRDTGVFRPDGASPAHPLSPVVDVDKSVTTQHRELIGEVVLSVFGRHNEIAGWRRILRVCIAR